MNQLFSCALLALALSCSSSSALAQKPNGGGKSVPPSKTPASVPDTAENTSLGNIIFSGKVVIDDGTELTDQATIQTLCEGEKRNEAYTDSQGWFSFEFITRTPHLASNSGGVYADADTSRTNPTSTQGSQRDWKRCQLLAQLPGFTSDVKELSAISPLDRNDLGRIVLHRMQQVQGTTISVTSAAAPSAARKAFERGRDQEAKGKWEEAQQDFEKAVQIYLNYAVAWYELGRTQVRKNDTAGAAYSFDQALAADPKFAPPYQGLAELAFHAKQWPRVVNLTEKLLALNPVSFPDAWYFNSVGNYSLQNLDVAEKSARQGIRTDEGHTIPKLEYVLGIILMEKRNYQEAAVHMQQYLHLGHTPADVDEAQKQLAEITRLSTTASVPARVEKITQLGLSSVADDTQKTAEIMLDRARTLSDIRSPNAPAFRLNVAFSFQGRDLSTIQGTYSEIWISNSQWRRETVVNNLRRIEVGGPNSHWLVDGGDDFPEKAERVSAMVEMLPATTSKLEFESFIDSDSATRCAITKSRGENQVKDGFCFDKSSGYLVAHVAPELVGLRVADYSCNYNHFLKFGDYWFPREMVCFLDNHLQLEAKVINLSEAPSHEASLFAPPAGALEIGNCSQDVLPPEPVNTPIAKSPPGMRYRRSLVVVSVIVDIRGKPQNVKISKSGGKQFDDAALATVRGWQFKPATCSGEAMPSQANLEIRFFPYVQ